MKLKEEGEKVGLKLNIHKTKIMASGPITSWEIDGETVDAVSDFTFWRGSKITQMVAAAMKLKDVCSLGKSYDKPRQHIHLPKNEEEGGPPHCLLFICLYK